MKFALKMGFFLQVLGKKRPFSHRGGKKDKKIKSPREKRAFLMCR